MVRALMWILLDHTLWFLLFLLNTVFSHFQSAMVHKVNAN